MKIKSTLTIAATCFLVACAANPESIAPTYVSHVTYSSWSCNQLKEEEVRLNAALSAASDAQKQARTNDTVGIIFLGLPVSSLSGSNQASNIGRLKGELDAVRKAMILKNCR